MKHFRLLGSVDVGRAVEHLDKLRPFWLLERLRQSTPGSPHADTECVYVRMPEAVDATTIFSSMDVTTWLYSPVYDALTEAVAAYAGQRPARVMLVKLKAGGYITPHVDEGAYAEATDRYHLALVTNPLCVMRIGDEEVSGAAGEVWWFDKHAQHSVHNGGDDRVHLIVDCWRSKPLVEADLHRV